MRRAAAAARGAAARGAAARRAAARGAAPWGAAARRRLWRWTRAHQRPVGVGGLVVSGAGGLVVGAAGGLVGGWHSLLYAPRGSRIATSAQVRSCLHLPGTALSCRASLSRAPPQEIEYSAVVTGLIGWLFTHGVTNEAARLAAGVSRNFLEKRHLKTGMSRLDLLAAQVIAHTCHAYTVCACVRRRWGCERRRRAPVGL